MRQLWILPLLALAIGCADQTLVEPDLAAAPDVASAQDSHHPGDAVKLVPMKMKGIWWNPETGNAAPCARFSGSFPTFIEFEGTATHMGRVTGTGTNCLSIHPDLGLIVLSQTAWMTAANGDVLLADGTMDDDPPIGGDLIPGVSFSIGPVLFDGGTGRFENAAGWYTLQGDYSGDPGGKFTITGMISSVGSSK
jgi:hypothetical protein